MESEGVGLNTGGVGRSQAKRVLCRETEEFQSYEHKQGKEKTHELVEGVKADRQRLEQQNCVRPAGINFALKMSSDRPGGHFGALVWTRTKQAAPHDQLLNRHETSMVVNWPACAVAPKASRSRSLPAAAKRDFTIRLLSLARRTTAMDVTKLKEHKQQQADSVHQSKKGVRHYFRLIFT